MKKSNKLFIIIPNIIILIYNTISFIGILTVREIVITGIDFIDYYFPLEIYDKTMNKDPIGFILGLFICFFLFVNIYNFNKVNKYIHKLFLKLNTIFAIFMIIENIRLWAIRR